MRVTHERIWEELRFDSGEVGGWMAGWRVKTRKHEHECYHVFSSQAAVPDGWMDDLLRSMLTNAKREMKEGR